MVGVLRFGQRWPFGEDPREPCRSVSPALAQRTGRRKQLRDRDFATVEHLLERRLEAQIIEIVSEVESQPSLPKDSNTVRTRDDVGGIS